MDLLLMSAKGVAKYVKRGNKLDMPLLEKNKYEKVPIRVWNRGRSAKRVEKAITRVADGCVRV